MRSRAHSLDALPRQNAAEVESWQRVGLNTAPLKELQDKLLELQDTELADAILNASEKFDAAQLLASERLATRSMMRSYVAHNTFAGNFSTKPMRSWENHCRRPGQNVYTNEAFLIMISVGTMYTRTRPVVRTDWPGRPFPS
jgi:hypothetical protein